MGYNGEAFAQTGAGDLGDVDAVVEDLAGDDVGEAEQRQNEGGFAGAGAADDGDALAGFEFEVDVGENVGAVWLVADGDVAEFNVSRGWPVVGDDVGFVVGEVAF